MKRRYFCIVCTVAAAFLATPARGEVPPLSDEACQAIVAYTPDEDVSADYRPGVDVAGRPVVEADAGGAPGFVMPETVEFDLTFDVAQSLGLAPAAGRVEGLISLGRITVLPSGQLLRDGRPLESAAETAMKALCRERLEGL